MPGHADCGAAMSETMLHRLAELWEGLETLTGVVAVFFIGYLPTVALVLASFAARDRLQWLWAMLAVFTLLLAIWVTRLVGAALYDRYPQFRPAPTRRGLGRGKVGVDEACCDPCTTSGEDLPRLDAETGDGAGTFHEAVGQIARGPSRPLALLVADRVRGVPVLLRPIVGLWWLGHFAGGALIGHWASRMFAGVLNNPGFGFLVVVPLALQFALLFAVNLYLVMAVAVVSRDRRPHEFVWRWRLAIDVLVSAGIILWAG